MLICCLVSDVILKNSSDKEIPFFKKKINFIPEVIFFSLQSGSLMGTNLKDEAFF